MQALQRGMRVALVTAAALALNACVMYPQGAPRNGGYAQSQPSYPATPYGTQAGGYNQGGYAQQGYAQSGQVMNVETVRVQDGSGVGAGGAIVGGVLGGVLGHQIGGGTGRDLATIAGVVGGALAGHAVQNNVGGGSVRDIYRVTVQLQDGSVRAFDYQYAPDFRAGDYVRVDGNQLYR